LRLLPKLSRFFQVPFFPLVFGFHQYPLVFEVWSFPLTSCVVWDECFFYVFVQLVEVDIGEYWTDYSTLR
jgi:hypothetical protein